eukprot:COSAG05_NODE_633_length_8198_cov_7.449191_2_plen_195_part_00
MRLRTWRGWKISAGMYGAASTSPHQPKTGSVERNHRWCFPLASIVVAADSCAAKSAGAAAAASSTGSAAASRSVPLMAAACRARCIAVASGMAKALGSSTVARVVATASIMVLVAVWLLWCVWLLGWWLVVEPCCAGCSGARAPLASLLPRAIACARGGWPPCAWVYCTGGSSPRVEIDQNTDFCSACTARAVA